MKNSIPYSIQFTIKTLISKFLLIFPKSIEQLIVKSVWNNFFIRNCLIITWLVKKKQFDYYDGKTSPESKLNAVWWGGKSSYTDCMLRKSYYKEPLSLYLHLKLTKTWKSIFFSHKKKSANSMLMRRKNFWFLSFGMI